MPENLREKYKVEKSNVDEAYEYEIGLKNNAEYQQRVDNTFIQIANLFKQFYPNVQIEPPKAREKSNRSLKIKLENLEIERLCKLYAIEGLSKQEKFELFEAIIKSMDFKEEQTVKELCFEKIDNLEKVHKIMSNDQVPEKTKTGLLRIVKTRLLHQEQTEQNIELQKELDNSYGKGAVKRTGKLKDNLLRWETIEKLTGSGIQKIYTPLEYLKVKDLMGFKITIAHVPDDVKTNSEKLKELLNARSAARQDELSKFEDLCALELSKEFVQNLMNSPELLKELNLQVIPEGYKHKEKQNGYIAEHLKLCYIDKPEYTFEFQVHSLFRENLSMPNGVADHAQRSGKSRVFPGTTNKQEFINEVDECVPKYRILKMVDGKYQLHKCSQQENLMEYYLGYGMPYEEIEKGLELLDEERGSMI